MRYADIYITCRPNEAKKIALALVQKRLAACVNILPCRSIYRWKGKLYDEKERILIAKTRANLFPQIEKAVKEICSYSVPCILQSEIMKGHKPYLKWLEKETR